MEVTGALELESSVFLNNAGLVNAGLTLNNDGTAVLKNVRFEGNKAVNEVFSAPAIFATDLREVGECGMF